MCDPAGCSLGSCAESRLELQELGPAQKSSQQGRFPQVLCCVTRHRRLRTWPFTCPQRRPHERPSGPWRRGWRRGRALVATPPRTANVKLCRFSRGLVHASAEGYWAEGIWSVSAGFCSGVLSTSRSCLGSWIFPSLVNELVTWNLRAKSEYSYTVLPPPIFLVKNVLEIHNMHVAKKTSLQTIKWWVKNDSPFGRWASVSPFIVDQFFCTFYWIILCIEECVCIRAFIDTQLNELRGILMARARAHHGHPTAFSHQ